MWRSALATHWAPIDVHETKSKQSSLFEICSSCGFLLSNQSKSNQIKSNTCANSSVSQSPYSLDANIPLNIFRPTLLVPFRQINLPELYNFTSKDWDLPKTERNLGYDLLQTNPCFIWKSNHRGQSSTSPCIPSKSTLQNGAAKTSQRFWFPTFKQRLRPPRLWMLLNVSVTIWVPSILSILCCTLSSHIHYTAYQLSRDGQHP